MLPITPELPTDRMTVLYIEDVRPTFDGVKNWITEAGFKMLPWAKDLVTVSGYLERGEVDILVVDLGLETFGSETNQTTKSVIRWRNQYPDLKILVYSQNRSYQPDIVNLLISNRISCITKEDCESAEEFVAAMRHVGRGGVLFSKSVTSYFPTFRPNDSILSEKQWKVLGIMSWGKSHREIADMLTEGGERTGENRVAEIASEIYRRLGIRSKGEAQSWFHLKNSESEIPAWVIDWLDVLKRFREGQ